jgi:hypothetical protein
VEVVVEKNAVAGVVAAKPEPARQLVTIPREEPAVDKAAETPSEAEGVAETPSEAEGVAETPSEAEGVAETPAEAEGIESAEAEEVAAKTPDDQVVVAEPVAAVQHQKDETVVSDESAKNVVPESAVVDASPTLDLEKAAVRVKTRRVRRRFKWGWPLWGLPLPQVASGRGARRIRSTPN